MDVKTERVNAAQMDEVAQILQAAPGEKLRTQSLPRGEGKKGYSFIMLTLR